MVLPIACLLSALWAATLAYQANQASPLSLLTDVLEILRNAGWSAFLIILLGPFQQSDISSTRRIRPAVAAIVALYIACLAIALYSHTNSDFPSA